MPTFCGTAGQIVFTTTPFNHSNLLLADGSEVAVSYYPSLAAAYDNGDGTYRYDKGDEGSGNFRLPNLVGRFPLGVSTLGSNQAGNQSGSSEVTLSNDNLPAHTHSASVQCVDDDADSQEASGNALANTSANTYSTSGTAVTTLYANMAYFLHPNG